MMLLLSQGPTKKGGNGITVCKHRGKAVITIWNSRMSKKTISKAEMTATLDAETIRNIAGFFKT